MSTSLLCLCVLLLGDFKIPDPAKPTLAIRVMNMDSARERMTQSKTFKLPGRKGVIVLGTGAYTPAAKANIGAFTIITAMNNKPIATNEDFIGAADALVAGEEVILDVVPAQRAKNGGVKWLAAKRVRATPATWKDVVAAHVRRSTDEVTGITWVHHRDQKRDHPVETGITLYYGIENGKKQPLRLMTTYRDDGWVFMDRVQARLKNKLREFELGRADREIIYGGLVQEQSDQTMTPEIREFMELLIEEGSTTVRLIGNKRHDFETTLEQIDQWAMMLLAHEMLD